LIFRHQVPLSAADAPRLRAAPPPRASAPGLRAGPPRRAARWRALSAGGPRSGRGWRYRCAHARPGL